MWLTKSSKTKNSPGLAKTKPVKMATSDSSDSDEHEVVLMGNIDNIIRDNSFPNDSKNFDDSKNVSFNLPTGHDSDSIFADNDSEKSHTELVLKVSKLMDR